MSKNVSKRLNQHNKGLVRSTKAYRPLEIVFQKEFSTSIDARKFEKFLKIGSNKEKLIALLKNK